MRNPLVFVEDRQAIVERLEDVVVELPHPPELFGLQVQTPIKSPVLDRRRDLASHGRQQRQVFAVERLVGVLAPERQHGNCRVLEDARDEVENALIAPALHLFGYEARRSDRVVERDGVSSVQPLDK